MIIINHITSLSHINHISLIFINPRRMREGYGTCSVIRSIIRSFCLSNDYDQCLVLKVMQSYTANAGSEVQTKSVHREFQHYLSLEKNIVRYN